MKQVLTFTFILFSLSIFAQKADQLNIWYTYAGNHKIADQYKIHTLLSQRMHDGLFRKSQQSLIRIGLIRDISKSLAIGVGYDNAVTFPYGEHPTPNNETEHRSFERIVIKNDVTNKIKMSQRFLLEQRYVAGKDTKHRLRYRITASMPLVKLKNDKVLKLVGFDEFFIKFDNSPNRFNQNWAYLGVGYPIDKTKAISLGYMNQYLVKGDRSKIENNHTPSLSFKWDLDLRKNK